MAIIRYTKDENIRYAYLNIFPDQFKTEAEKQEDSWVKNTMDYFATKAYAEYVKNRESFVKNYDLVKGILRKEDFYISPEVKSFTEMLMEDVGLPEHIKHYSILSTPINELVGELSNRPDGYKVKAFDDESKSEELEYKTQLLQEYILSEARQIINRKLALQGQDLSDEEINNLTLEEVKDEMEAYTSVAEKWANHTLTATKADYNVKEMSEEGFRDLQITSREYFGVYEDNSKVGFNIKVENPKNVWYLTTPDKKYVSDPSGRAQGAYAAGTVYVMDISEIIETFPDLTKEEIDHLRKGLQDYGLINVRESNLFSNPTPGIDSIKYDTYDPLVLQTRMMLEGEMKENNDNLKDFLGLTSNVSSFGYKYVVVRSFFLSKKKIGKLTYEDDLGNIQTTLVDENYVEGTIPTEIEIEWGWINQWYQGVKIGPDIYHMKPFNLLNYCPIIGINFEVKNTESRSLVDLMKPFQVLYNICMNQLYELFEKEIGNVANVNMRRIPKLKDGDDQDAFEMWITQAKEQGIAPDDDSPENTKGAVTNQSVARNMDLTRSQEMKTRIELAEYFKAQCWELIGMNRERLGKSQASATATGQQSNLQQSYSQTEPLFVAHEYLLGQLYQAIIDAAKYVQSQKPESTLSYITSKGESAFVQVSGTELLRDLKVFPTNRPEDRKLFQELKELGQPLLQNGGSFHDVITLYSTDSIRQMKKVFKTLQDKMDEMKEREMQQQQQQIDQTAQIAQAQLQQQQRIEAEKIANDNYQKAQDRISKEKIAIIQASGFGKVTSDDTDNNGIPDVLESQKLVLEQNKALNDYNASMAEIARKTQESSEKTKLEKEKLKVARENMKNDEKIARINAKAKKAAKPPSKKK